MCSSVAKCVLIVFNAIFFLIGAGLFAGAAYITWANDDIKSYLEVISFAEDVNDAVDEINTSDNLVQIGLYVAMGVGAFIAIICLMGCCGALKKNPCLLNVYCAFCVLLLLAEVTVAILAVIFKDDIEDKIGDGLTKQAQEQVKPYDNDTISTAWHVMQKELQCCGGTGPQDYQNNTYFSDMIPVPLTCCVFENDQPANPEQCTNEARDIFNSVDTVPDMEYIYTVGCHEALIGWLDDQSLYFIIGGASVAVIQIIGIILACCVKKEAQKE